MQTNKGLLLLRGTGATLSVVDLDSPTYFHTLNRYAKAPAGFDQKGRQSRADLKSINLE